MEAARHPHYLQPNIEIPSRDIAATKRPTKPAKIRTWAPTLPPYTTTNLYNNKEDGKYQCFMRPFSRDDHCILSLSFDF